MDGIELADYVRKRWPPTIIVVSSGKVVPRHALAESVSFLAKPYDDTELRSVIDGVKARLA
jgi:CheY-like chemotaxis protein